MDLKRLKIEIQKGEDSSRQFKENITNADALATEISAFANTNGGVIFFGVTDDGKIKGLEYKDVARINQLTSNAASHLYINNSGLQKFF